MNNIELNRVAIWRAKHLDQMTEKVTPPGRIAFKDKVAFKTTHETHRFAKNYRSDDGSAFCLFAITYRDDAEAIEKELDEIAEQLDEAEIAKAVETASDVSFTYTKHNLKELI